MAIKEHFERLHLTELAIHCQRVSESPHMATATAERARKLKMEWASIQKPLLLSLKDQEELQPPEADLKARMVEFLQGI